MSQRFPTDSLPRLYRLTLFVSFSVLLHAGRAVKNRTRPEKCILDFSRLVDDETYAKQSQ